MTQKKVIEALIEKAGSQKELAKIAGISEPRVSEWKTEFHAISFIKLLEICEKMRINLKDLL